MCGVFGYVGQPTDVGRAVITALRTLEYRGYDSWGVAISTADALVIDKDVGRINGRHRSYPEASVGFGHTRWATHGGVTEANAHPHRDCAGRCAVVHNGIIENHVDLRIELQLRGHRFQSETDSEIVAHLVEEHLANGEVFAAAVATVFGLLDGYNAIVVMDHFGEQLAATKNVSPLVIGQRECMATVASDAIALRGYADRLIYLEDDQLAILTRNGVEVMERSSLLPVQPITFPLDDSRGSIELGDHPDFLSKEVSEQPETLGRLISEAKSEITALANELRTARKIVMVGCGTAGNAALAATYLFSQICQRDVTYLPASEFRYRAGPLDSETIVLALSQSGETVDVLEAMTDARNHGSRLAAMVNSPNSTLDRMVDTSVKLRAGVEQCVLATKSYTAMLAALLLTAHQMDERWETGADLVMQARDGIVQTLSPPSRAHIAELGRDVANVEHLFVIGRGVHFPSALEAALKIKEVSYIHAEGFAAGELKHGVIALIEPGTPCLVFAPHDDTRTDVLSGASELRSRGARIIGIGTSNDEGFDDFIAIPDVGLATAIVEAVPCQLFGYAAAIARGHDPDRPRNLAKSVTVK